MVQRGFARKEMIIRGSEDEGNEKEQTLNKRDEGEGKLAQHF